MDVLNQPFGRFLLRRELKDWGAHSKLYLAVDAEKFGPLVLKIPTNTDVEEAVRFEHEIEMGLRLRHPNLIQAFEGGRIDNSPYLALEWIRGKSAAIMAQTAGKYSLPLPSDIVAGLMAQALRGLAYAQSIAELKFVHRDISPENIMVTYDGEAKLIDYGLSKSTDKPNQTNPGIITGTLGYIAPEQLVSGAPASARTDVYSMGAVFWHLLTYAPPPDWTHPESKGKVRQRLNDLAIPQTLAAIVIKALEPKPENRYQSAAKMAVALEQTKPADAKKIGASMRTLFAGAYAVSKEELAELEHLCPSATHRNETQMVPMQRSKAARSGWSWFYLGMGLVVVCIGAASYFLDADNHNNPSIPAPAIIPKPPAAFDLQSVANDLMPAADGFTDSVDASVPVVDLAPVSVIVISPPRKPTVKHQVPNPDPRLAELDRLIAFGTLKTAEQLCFELERDPAMRSDALYAHARIFFQRAEYEKAMTYATQSFNAKPNDRAILLRANSALRSQKWEIARSDFEQYLKKHADSQEAQQGLTVVRRHFPPHE